jgi:A/G-specific adenine glycosylase
MMAKTTKNKTFSAELLAWFGEHRRPLPWRETGDPYRIWLSETMLQQTQAHAVIPYYNRFLARFPDMRSLAAADEDDVLKLWEGLGYYRRIHHFIAAVKEVCNRHDGNVPNDPGAFRNLSGVGDYTAAAVMSIAFGHRLPVVDANVLRVTTRYFRIAEAVDKAKTKRMIREELKRLIPDNAPGDFNQAMMELGALVCTPRNPRCDTCPIAGGCGAYAAGETDRYPRIARKPKVPEYHVALGLVMQEGRFLIQKRPSSGHLAGMWELPGGKIRDGESPEQALRRKCREELGMDILVHERCAAASHAYSHFKIHVFLYRCNAGRIVEKPVKNQTLAWIDSEEIPDYPFPSVNHKLFAALSPPASL